MPVTWDQVPNCRVPPCVAFNASISRLRGRLFASSAKVAFLAVRPHHVTELVLTFAGTTRGRALAFRAKRTKPPRVMKLAFGGLTANLKWGAKFVGRIGITARRPLVAFLAPIAFGGRIGKVTTYSNVPKLAFGGMAKMPSPRKCKFAFKAGRILRKPFSEVATIGFTAASSPYGGIGDPAAAKLAFGGMAKMPSPRTGKFAFTGLRLLRKPFDEAATLAFGGASANLTFTPGEDMTGDIKFAAYSTVPTGWLLCNGAAVSRTTFRPLFLAIGTTFGVGDGSTTFNVPDLSGRVPIGAGKGAGLSARGLADKGGEETHLLTAGELPAAGADVSLSVDTTSTAGPSGGWDSTSLMGGVDGGDNTMNVVGTVAGSGQVHNNMQPFTTLLAIIKT